MWQFVWHFVTLKIMTININVLQRNFTFIFPVGRDNPSEFNSEAYAECLGNSLFRVLHKILFDYWEKPHVTSCIKWFLLRFNKWIHFLPLKNRENQIFKYHVQGVSRNLNTNEYFRTLLYIIYVFRCDQRHCACADSVWNVLVAIIDHETTFI